MTRTEKCIKRANYVLGYCKPKFTKDETDLIREYVNWKIWKPGSLMWLPNSEDAIKIAKPNKPNISSSLLEKKKLYDEWVDRFNWYYDNI